MVRIGSGRLPSGLLRRNASSVHGRLRRIVLRRRNGHASGRPSARPKRSGGAWMNCRACSGRLWRGHARDPREVGRARAHRAALRSGCIHHAALLRGHFPAPWCRPRALSRVQRTLAGAYNERFDSLVLRSYDHTQLSPPGLVVTFKPRPHQVAAVARMIGEPANEPSTIRFELGGIDQAT